MSGRVDVGLDNLGPRGVGRLLRGRQDGLLGLEGTRLLREGLERRLGRRGPR